MKAVAGMKMSYQLQLSIAAPQPGSLVRGFRTEETHSALCSHLFSMVRSNRQHRRAFLISLLNLFDDSAKTEVNMLLFIADNLACFPFQSQDEPLFIMHHIDITLSVSGSNLLQSFKESLLKKEQRQERKQRRREERERERERKERERRERKYNNSEDEDEDEERHGSRRNSS